MEKTDILCLFLFLGQRHRNTKLQGNLGETWKSSGPIPCPKQDQLWCYKDQGFIQLMLWFSPSRQLSTMWPLAHSFSLQWDVEENWKKKVKLVGWDKDSLLGQQRERKTTTTVLTKEYTKQVMHNAICSPLRTWCLAHPWAAIPPPWPASPL